MSTHPFGDFPTNDQQDAETYAETVARIVVQIMARKEAEARVAALEAPPGELPPAENLADLLMQDDEEQDWIVAGMWPANGRINLVAAPKAGKTTMLLNLVRSLVDGHPFLGAFDVHPPQPTSGDAPLVTIFDTEMTGAQLRRWYRAIGVRNAAKVRVVRLRGQASRLNFLDAKERRKLVEKYAGSAVYVLDPVAPVLTTLGLEENSNSDVQKFLTQWDEFVHDLGGSTSAIVHHAGHAGDRARGASAFLGSGDAVWTLTVGDSEAGETPIRYLRTEGRFDDGGLPETALNWDPATHLLTLGQSRAEQVAEDALGAVLDVLQKADGEPMSQRGIEDAVKVSGVRQKDARAAIKLGRSRKLVYQFQGARGAHLHVLSKPENT